MQSLPEMPDAVGELRTHQAEDTGLRQWFEEYTYYIRPDGIRVRHGLAVTKERRGDADPREYDRQYIQVKTGYYHGLPADHWILSFYHDGVIEERRYFVDRQLAFDRRDEVVFPEGLRKRREMLDAFRRVYGE